jgi:hypothetical protein
MSHNILLRIEIGHWRKVLEEREFKEEYGVSREEYVVRVILSLESCGHGCPERS